ncbi:MAG TPA: SOS response-associated peptidase [Leptolyngbyaceae cyanobacterium]
MCGRFTLIQIEKLLTDIFQVSSVPSLSPRYNIAPTQSIATILQNSETEERECKMMKWGLIPSWSKDTKIGAKMINARAETLAEKPAFRSAFKRRRCLIVADGFYEWKTQDGKKQPFYFRLADGKPFGFAGLWERWEKEDSEAIESCTIITISANELMQPIHDRMPVILDERDYDRWLDPKVQKPESLQSLLQPYRSQEMTCYPVSTKVNNARTDSPECLKQA